ncbi:MAG: hypothetical protein SVU32_00750 [Candidatus Nanohaloarchaea archaeon]|nr:hypothetical protein [Candidatus Nanohaloarchaea archaeon]
MDVSTVLERYGLTRETARNYVLNAVGNNLTETSEAMGVSYRTAARYREAFQEMSVAERATVLNGLTESLTGSNSGGDC